MKNATGISRWTSAGRNHAVHILNDEGSLVLCKKQFFSHDTEPLDIEKVTCQKCKDVFKKMNGYAQIQELPIKPLLVKPIVSNRYLFWFEDEGKEGWTFEIEAKDYEQAYEKAYDTHGPQVEGMMYQLL